jgi:hypothetical protein
MQSKLQIFCILLVLTFSLAQSPPQVQQLYETSSINIEPQFYANQAFYDENIIYNTSTSSFSIVKLPGNCTGALQVTLNSLVWCLGVNSATNQFSINQLTPSASSIVASYPVNKLATSQNVNGSLILSGNFLIVLIEDLQNVKYISQIVFDSQALNFICPAINSLTITGDGVTSAYGGGALVSSYFNANGVPFIAVFGCEASETVLTASNINFTTSGQLVSINGSNVFAQISSSYFLGETVNYIQTFGVEPDGSIYFGQKMLPALAVPCNSSLILQVVSTKTNLVISYLTVGLSLGIFVIDQVEFGITDTSAYINYIQGSSLIQIIVDQSLFTYDLDAQEIASVISDNPPILLANGTVINITTFGYFSQSPGQNIQFTAIPAQDIYYDPSDSLKIWTLFVPMPLLPQAFPNCTVIEILVNTSTVRTIFYPSCPNSQSQLPAQIKDVKEDANGNPAIAYRDGLGNLIIVTTQGVLGKLVIPILYQYPAFSINLTNGTGIVVAIKLSSFVLGHFNISTGVIYETISIQGQIHNAICKLNHQYYVLASSRQNQTTFTVWDAVSLLESGSVTANVTLQIIAYQPLVALGVNTSNPVIFSGLVLVKGPQQIYVIDPNGQNTQLNIPLAEDVVQVAPNDQNSFFLLSTPIDRINVMLYEVNWDLSEMSYDVY